MKLLKSSLFALSAVLLSACSSIPDRLQGTPGLELAKFDQVLESGGHLKDEARWGGVITGIENKAKGTVVEVVNFELNGFGRPQVSDKSSGRFKVYIDKFLDPAIYKKGRSVSVLGTVSDSEEGSIGEYKYRFPVLKASDLYLWKEVKRVEVDVYNQWPYWYHRPYPYYYPSRVVIRKSPTPKTKKSN